MPTSSPAVLAQPSTAAATAQPSSNAGHHPAGVCTAVARRGNGTCACSPYAERPAGQGRRHGGTGTGTRTGTRTRKRCCACESAGQGARRGAGRQRDPFSPCRRTWPAALHRVVRRRSGWALAAASGYRWDGRCCHPAPCQGSDQLTPPAGQARNDDNARRICGRCRRSRRERDLAAGIVAFDGSRATDLLVEELVALDRLRHDFRLDVAAASQ